MSLASAKTMHIQYCTIVLCGRYGVTGVTCAGRSARSSPAAAVVRRLVPARRGQPRRRACPADSDESDRLLPDDGVAESRI